MIIVSLTVIVLKRGVGTMEARGHRPPQYFNWGGLPL